VDVVLGANSILSGTGVTGVPIRDAEFPNAPSYSGNYLVRYNWNVGSGNVAVQLDGAFYDDQFLEVTNGSGTVQEAYNVSNVRLTYTDADERFSIGAWVKNANDEIYKQYSLDLGVLGATTYYAPPRTYGVTARFYW
jgi:iron complex outermembrane receptor protein